MEHVALKYLINHKKGEGGQGPPLNLPLRPRLTCMCHSTREKCPLPPGNYKTMGFLVFLLRQGFCKSQHHALT